MNPTIPENRQWNRTARRIGLGQYPDEIRLKAGTTVTPVDLNAWLHRSDRSDLTDFPYETVVAEYRCHGKHFVSEEFLDTLAAARETLPDISQSSPDTMLLRRFLQVALDKRDGSYDYTSYIALSLLPAPTIDDGPADESNALPRRDRLVVQLVADTIQFELDAAEGQPRYIREDRPDARTVDKRIRLATRVAVPALVRLGLAPDFGLLDPECAKPDSARAARLLCAAVLPEMTHRDHLILQLTMLPVSVSHDEYLFIRVLQLFEISFAALTVQLLGAVHALTLGNGADAAAHLVGAEATLREAAPMFSLLATMQVEAFRSFRTATHGASAIQSRNYKILEALCRRPDQERLDSAAFTSTPEVRDCVLAGSPTVDDAFESACAAGRLDPVQRHEVHQAMRSFSAALERWRHTHYRLAVRMIGDTPGTGYTAGTTYLRSARSIEVFRTINRAGEGERYEVG